MDIVQSLRLQARANRLANLRLAAAMAPLTDDELRAPRTSFFPSLWATLEHIVQVDGYYIGVLAGDAEMAGYWARTGPIATRQQLGDEQRASDERLIAVTAALDAAGSARLVEMPRSGGRIDRDSAAGVLLHLFMHQTHHRGQVHAMLAGTRIAPPQLDEFLLASDADLRADEMRELGWSEAALRR